jgi:hypothetical protein
MTKNHKTKPEKRTPGPKPGILKLTSKKHRLKPLSLHPLKAAEPIRFFLQVDPTRVETDMRRLRQKSGKAAALPKG